MKLDYKPIIFGPFILLLFFGSFCLAQSSRVRPTPAPIVTSDSALTILVQPDPVLTAAQKESVEGMTETLQLRVEFLDGGYIGAITPVNSFPGDLTQAAIDAAAKIKFEPEKKNGRPVTVYRIIEYSFFQEKPRTEQPPAANTAKAEEIIRRAVDNLGGEKYLQIRTQIGRGKFSLIRDSRNVSFQSFIDIIVYPDKEITQFKERGIRIVQANYGETGWMYDGAVETLRDQTDSQIQFFNRAMRTNLDNFLRGVWRDEGAVLDYVGRREAGIGKRNDVVSLLFSDGFRVEFEFADDGLPMKTVYKHLDSAGREITEENRFGQFVISQGIRTPFVVDHFTNEAHTSRINYQEVEYNRPVSDEIFRKPSNTKALEKDLKP